MESKKYPINSLNMSTVVTEIQNTFETILASLAEKERSVIIRRIGLKWERETLQEIGDTYGITRERVRQIEDVGIKKIGRIMRTSPLMKIQETGEKILQMHGGIMTRDRLISAIVADIGVEWAINNNIIDVLLRLITTSNDPSPSSEQIPTSTSQK